MSRTAKRRRHPEYPVGKWSTIQTGHPSWEANLRAVGSPPPGVYKAHLSGCRRYLVLESDFMLPGVGLVTHLWIRRTMRNPAWGWYVLQDIKSEICGPERVGIEVFPSESTLVDDADMRHLWVYPEDYVLPFGIHPGVPS